MGWDEINLSWRTRSFFTLIFNFSAPTLLHKPSTRHQLCLGPGQELIGCLSTQETPSAEIWPRFWRSIEMLDTLHGLFGLFSSLSRLSTFSPYFTSPPLSTCLEQSDSLTSWVDLSRRKRLRKPRTGLWSVDVGNWG